MGREGDYCLAEVGAVSASLQHPVNGVKVDSCSSGSQYRRGWAELVVSDPVS